MINRDKIKTEITDIGDKYKVTIKIVDPYRVTLHNNKLEPSTTIGKVEINKEGFGMSLAWAKIKLYYQIWDK